MPPVTHRPRLPDWLKVPYRGAPVRDEVKKLLQDLNLHTVCESANCPNRCDCWARGTATFLILGNTCTRNCRFCAVHHGMPGAVDADEPRRVAEAVKALGIQFAVITSVTRDDLPDGGASHFAATIRAVREAVSGIGVEVLTPDFGGRETDIAAVLAAGPDVFNHNIETCARLTAAVRSGADYARSLQVLAAAARMCGNRTAVKSGFMLGMGESEEEIRTLLRDLRSAGVQILTIGQYLPPSASHWPLDRYVTPEAFDRWGRIAQDEFGFEKAVSQPLARSSYLAEKACADARSRRSAGDGY